MLINGLFETKGKIGNDTRSAKEKGVHQLQDGRDA